MRRPRSLPLAVRARRLKLAGQAETNRAKLALTLQMVEPAAPVAVDEPATVRIPFQSMRETVYGRAA